MIHRAFPLGLLGLLPLLGCGHDCCSSAPPGRPAEGAGAAKATEADPGRQLVFKVRGLT